METTPGWERIRSFMQKAGQATPDRPCMPDLETRKLRARLILEEAFETIEKGLGLQIEYVYDGGYGIFISPLENDTCFQMHEIDEGPNLVEIVDGCEDIRVVTTGTLIACGVRDGRTSKEVDENNLAKFGPGGYRRDDGKWIKPPGHRPPDITGLLRAQGAPVDLLGE